MKEEVKVPKIIYLANKAEDGYEGDILGDFYAKFPHTAEQEDLEPIFISAEHGDGLADLYGAITAEIPAEKAAQYENRKEKRLQRFLELKDELMDDIVRLKMDIIERQRKE